MIRDGLPRLARAFRESRSARVVAFGSSITHDGDYLEGLAPAVRGQFPHCDVDIIIRALPGFMTFWAMHRTPTIVELDPDLVILEFAVNDHCIDTPEITAKSIEGIVRKLKSSVNPPDIAFVYFMSHLPSAVSRQKEVIGVWEQVAEHYGIPSIDCSAVVESMASSGRAVWVYRWPGRPSWDAEEYPIVLTRDMSHPMANVGRMLGEHVAKTIVEAAGTAATLSRTLPPPLYADNYADARTHFPPQLAREGWSRRALEDHVQAQAAVIYFSELLVADRPGAQLTIAFEGRHVMLWAHSAAGNVISLDGRRAQLDLPDPRVATPIFVVRQDAPSSHVIHIEAHELPLQIAAIDVLGEATFS
jgi:hypothetical protein